MIGRIEEEKNAEKKKEEHETYMRMYAIGDKHNIYSPSTTTPTPSMLGKGIYCARNVSSGWTNAFTADFTNRRSKGRQR